MCFRKGEFVVGDGGTKVGVVVVTLLRQTRWMHIRGQLGIFIGAFCTGTKEEGRLLRTHNNRCRRAPH